MDKLFIVGVIAVSLAVSLPFATSQPEVMAGDCCFGPGCPVCDPFIPPPPPEPEPEPEGPPSPPRGFWEKFQQMMEQDQFSNDMFWWLRK